MIKMLFATFITFFACEGHSPSSINKNSDSLPFTYTIVLQDVYYTNGFALENGIRTKTPFKCPLYYVDSLGLIVEICPDNGTSDTITIYHSQDQLELVHSIRGLNFFYYRLNAGDTLSLHYEDGIPIADSPKQNVYYNLIKDNPYEKMRDRHFIELPGPNSLYNKYKSKDEFPAELERLLPLYRNLDSLYLNIKKSHNYQLDYIKNNTDSPGYWTGILNKEMRRLVLLSYFIDDSDTSLYGKESNFDVYSISDQFYYKDKFNQNPDSLFNLVQHNSLGINPDLARYYFQLYLERFAEKEPQASINNMITEYYKLFSEHRDTVFIQELRTKMGVEESLANDIKIRNNAGVETTLMELIVKETASLYYIDYWASWCAPCREEIPYSIDLKKQLEGMNIRFIYLAYNDRLDNWKKAVEEHDLSQYNYSYFITNSRSSQQLVDYNIKTIPRYMILDKDGKVMVSNAQRPSDPALKKLLLKGLKED